MWEKSRLTCKNIKPYPQGGLIPHLTPTLALFNEIRLYICKYVIYNSFKMVCKLVCFCLPSRLTNASNRCIKVPLNFWTGSFLIKFRQFCSTKLFMEADERRRVREDAGMHLSSYNQLHSQFLSSKVDLNKIFTLLLMLTKHYTVCILGLRYVPFFFSKWP